MEPDQLASQKPADQDLQCLKKQDISGVFMISVNANVIYMYQFTSFLILIIYTFNAVTKCREKLCQLASI